MELFIILIISFSIGFGGARLVSLHGSRWNLLDMPSGRSSHDIPTPKGGGIGIPLAALVITLLYTQSLSTITGTAIGIAALAFINDRMELPVSIRFFADLILAAACVLLLKPPIQLFFSETGGEAIHMISVVGLAIVLVAATNFFNFMDGINGIAGFEAIISFGLMAAFVLIYRDLPQLSNYCLAIIAATGGFLPLNFPRAKVFMGDVGSTFLGFAYAALVLSIAKNPKEILLLFLFQAIFYIDCISTIILRLIQKENIFQAHRKHLYQKLVHVRKWPHPKVTLLVGFAQAILGISGLLFFKSGLVAIIVLWVAAVTIYWGVLIAKRLTKA